MFSKPTFYNLKGEKVEEVNIFSKASQEKYPDMLLVTPSKTITYIDVANYLGVKASTVYGYQKKKKELMLIGLISLTGTIVKPKKAKITDLAKYLNKAYSTVAKYPKKKKELMLIGLYASVYNLMKT